MKYIIMCGGIHREFNPPKPLTVICGESLVERTIRLLRKHGINDIAVSVANDDTNYDSLDVEILKKENRYDPDNADESKRVGYWVEAFWETDEPCCYLCGDVWYSEEALEKIINNSNNDFMMFGGMSKGWDEPLGFKVNDQKLLRKYCDIFKQYENSGKFSRKGMSWELYRLIEGYNPNVHKKGPRYFEITNFAFDIDHIKDISILTNIVQNMNKN